MAAQQDGSRAEKALRKAQTWRLLAICAAGFAVVMAIAGASFVIVFAGAVGAVLNFIRARRTADLYGIRRHQRLERYVGLAVQVSVLVVLAILLVPHILPRP